MSSSLTPLQNTLESILSRLSILESNAGIKAPAGGNYASPATGGGNAAAVGKFIWCGSTSMSHVPVCLLLGTMQFLVALIVHDIFSSFLLPYMMNGVN